jgi:predicted lipoprotein with Yx(FWY)xxD motif
LEDTLPKLTRTSAAAAGLATLALAAPAVADPGYPTGSAAPAAPTTNPVVEWNRTLLTMLRTPGLQPATVHPTRSLALLHAAIYDAVVSIDHRSPAYRVSIRAPRADSRPAAADAAAATVLDALYTSRSSTTDTQLRTDLAALGGGDRVRDGARVGRVIARRLLALRANDGSAATPPSYTSTGAPGDFMAPPPALAAPVFTHWANVTPFVLASAGELRPPAPPAVASPASLSALREVESLGSATSATRTADQTQIARFWAAPIQNYWNEIAQSAVLARRADLDTSARAFALLDLAQADTTIAFYDAKYAYRVWRPVTAIRATDDPNWTPLGTTPSDPSYPGAHSAISTVSAAVLTSVLGAHQHLAVASEVLPGVTRSFTSFDAAALEAGLSRIYAGVHTRLDHRAGATLGQGVARAVLEHALAATSRATSRRPARAAASAAGATVGVRRSPLGAILVDGRGLTLYDFVKDKGDKSACYGACAALWPPLTTKGKPRAGRGVNARLLGTTRRKDGTLEVTYSRHPLYYYVADKRPGQTTGQGLPQFGAPWWVLAPNGREIHRRG